MPTSVDADVARKLDEFKQTVTAVAEDIVFRVFPTKILELTTLVDSTSNPDSPFHLSHALSSTDATVYPPPTSAVVSDEPDSKKRKRNGDGSTASSVPVPNDLQHARYPNLLLANKHTSQVHEEVKKECSQLGEYCDKVKLWVNLTMPKIEE